MGSITFISGPSRSGKSSFAVMQAKKWGDNVAFVATYRNNNLTDLEMQKRLYNHRRERPKSWRTLESPGNPLASLYDLNPQPSGVLMDCISLWLGDRLDAPDEFIIKAWNNNLLGFLNSPWPVILVGNEICWGPITTNAITRRFCDLCGYINQQTANISNVIWLCVSGSKIRLK